MWLWNVQHVHKQRERGKKADKVKIQNFYIKKFVEVILHFFSQLSSFEDSFHRTYIS